MSIFYAFVVGVILSGVVVVIVLSTVVHDKPHLKIEIVKVVQLPAIIPRPVEVRR